MTLTPQQLQDLQDDSGIGSDQAVFTDSELDRIWERVSGASSDTERHEAALYLIYRQLLGSANKLHDYTAGATSEKLSQVRANLKQMHDLYKPSYEAATSQATQFARTVLRKRPNQRRTRPYTSPEPTTRYDNTLDDQDY
jgi:hypothetical protein